jgi:hypothetical protein
MISTTKEAAQDRKSITAKLREKHQPYFNLKKVPDAIFIPKMAYKPSGKDELFIAFFQSELRKESDLYVEFVNRDLQPEDMNRNLWKWNYNPHWDEEYEKLENDRYLVPVSELVCIRTDEVVQTTHVDQVSFFDDDCAVSEMTVRDLLSVTQMKPVSNKAWLNALILDIMNANPKK